MEPYTAEAIRKILEALSPELFVLLWKGMLGIVIFNMVVTACKSLAIYVRIRMSNYFSSRTLIVYDGFEGIISEINISGIFLKNREGVIKFVPLTKWYEGDIQYPNVLDKTK